jgi:histidinol-phosphate phosphatase family protein
MKCAILAGGLGKRLRSVLGDIPKPMAPLAGTPLLERLIGLCRRFGIDEIHLLLSYRPEVIREYFGDGSAFGVRLTYWLDEQPLGTAGSMAPVLSALGEDVLLLYGDVFAEMDLARLMDYHQAHPDAAATLVLHPNDHPFDSDLAVLDGERVAGFDRAPHAAGVWRANLVNAGIQIVTPRLLPYIPEGRPSDFGVDVFPAAVAAGEFLAGYNTPEYIKDIGAPERYREVERDILADKPGRISLANARNAVFMDCDGTLNVLVPFLSRLEDVELYPASAAAVRAVNESGYLAIAVTNRPQVARGLLTPPQVQCLHNKLETLLGYERAKLDAIYYCPHHPDGGYAGESPEYKIPCRCRKPDTLLFEQAATRFHIDLTGSAVVGDSARDIEAARRLGCRAVLVETGLAGRDLPADIRPDFVARDLLQAVAWITGGPL